MTETTLSQEDQQKIIAAFADMDPQQMMRNREQMKYFAETLSMLFRALEGMPIDPDDVITRLTNVKNILERSRFPTYPLLAKQVYLRLIAKYHPEASACKDWADIEAEALISYKGQSRAEYVEMTKAPQMQPQQEFVIGQPRAMSGEQSRRRFWQRGPKQPEEELRE